MQAEKASHESCHVWYCLRVCTVSGRSVCVLYSSKVERIDPPLVSWRFVRNCAIWRPRGCGGVRCTVQCQCTASLPPSLYSGEHYNTVQASQEIRQQQLGQNTISQLSQHIFHLVSTFPGRRCDRRGWPSTDQYLPGNFKPYLRHFGHWTASVTS